MTEIILIRPNAKLNAKDYQNMRYSDITIDYTLDKNFSNSVINILRNFEYLLDNEFWFYHAHYVPRLNTIVTHEVYHSVIEFNFAKFNFVMAYSEKLSSTYVNHIKKNRCPNADCYLFFDDKGFRTSYSTGTIKKIHDHVYKIIIS
jgi:hypothetical protein